MTNRTLYGGYILLLIIIVILLLASQAFAQTLAPTNQHPLRDSLAWSTPLLASAAFDRQTSLYWSSHPSNCTEGNYSRRNADGTLDGWKATRDDMMQTAAYVSALYLTKRLHWKVAEKMMKVAILGRSGIYTYNGVQSLRLCEVTR